MKLDNFSGMILEGFAEINTAKRALEVSEVLQGDPEARDRLIANISIMAMARSTKFNRTGGDSSAVTVEVDEGDVPMVLDALRSAAESSSEPAIVVKHATRMIAEWDRNTESDGSTVED